MAASGTIATEMTATEVDVLQTIPLFRELPEADLQQLLGLLTERTFPAGEEIVSASRPEDGLAAGYLVLSGQVQLSLRGPGIGPVPAKSPASGVRSTRSSAASASSSSPRVRRSRTSTV